MLLDANGKPMPPSSLRHPATINAHFEAAQNTVENTRLWENARMQTPYSLYRRDVRWRLIARSRFTFRNNSYCQGMALTLAADTIGTGPQPQIEAANDKAANQLEEEFMEWMDEIHLADKLTQMRLRKCVDGENFGVEESNPRLAGEVKMSWNLYDCEQWWSDDEYFSFAKDHRFPGQPPVDGIEFDRWGNPIRYHRVPFEPSGEFSFLNSYIEPEPIDARYVYHFFDRHHSQQQRGVPEFTPALEQFEELRRYTKAVLAAAETAADMAIVLATNSPMAGVCQPISTGDSEDATAAFEQLDLPRRMMMIAPEGWLPQQIKGEQPTNTHELFVRQILREIARCISMPYNIAAGDSSEYNYASGRLDHQTYFRQRNIDRKRIERLILDRLFKSWFTERQFGDKPLPRVGKVKRVGWSWDEPEHVDPLKEAQAVAIYKEAGLLDLDKYWKSQKSSSADFLRRLARYKEIERQLGLDEASQMAQQQGGRSGDIRTNPRMPGSQGDRNPGVNTTRSTPRTREVN